MSTSEEKSATEIRLDDQIDWYDKKSVSNQSHYKTLKIFQLITAAIIPLVPVFLSISPYSISSAYGAIITSVLGALILVIESIQGLYQFHSNWISYRSTCEELKHEKFLWLAGAGHYANKNVQNPTNLLAERIESIVSKEHAKWVSATEKAEWDKKNLNSQRNE
jgi:hypothetical protein